MKTLTKSVRLSESLRDKITDALLKDKFVAETDALYVEAAKLADAAYARFFADDQEALRKMKTLPVGWLPELDAITVKFGGPGTRTVKLHFNGYSRFLPWKSFDNASKPFDEKRPFRQVDVYLSPQIELPKTDPLSKRYFALVATSEKIEKDRAALKKDIRGVLYSVSTTGQLIAAWPEVAAAVASALPDDSVVIKNLPAKTLRDLTAKLGLAAS